MLLSVRDVTEAARAAAAGVDAIEWVVPDGSDPGAVAAVRAAFPGRVRLRFEGSPAPHDLERARADEVAVRVAAGSAWPRPGDPAETIRRPVIAVIPATGGEIEAVEGLRGRVDGVMLDATPRRLIDEGGVARLDAFADACRRAALPFGFAGGLETPDIARLLLLEPDVLGFDTAARSHQAPDGPLDPVALEAIRALIPKKSHPVHAGDDAIVPSRVVVAPVTDLLFVRDFVTTLAIGAYRQEHGRRQRVRFSVEADVLRTPVPPRDMRDVFSYDVIIETIRVLAERGHATFVETLAEEIAAALLTHAALTGVTVRVEKLDVIDGAVGIEIRRRRGPTAR